MESHRVRKSNAPPHLTAPLQEGGVSRTLSGEIKSDVGAVKLFLTECLEFHSRSFGAVEKKMFFIRSRFEKELMKRSHEERTLALSLPSSS